MNRATQLKEVAQSLGLDAVGIAPAETPPGADHLRNWLSLSYHGEMNWMARRPEIRSNPLHYDRQAKTIIVAGISSHQTKSPTRRGKIAAYAQGLDYHEILREKLGRLAESTVVPWGGSFRICVDSSPLMEKPIAAMAGLGWQGKNTLLINTQHGPWLMLGFILTDLVIPHDKPSSDHCGTCTRCMDVCPTQAFPQPYVLDSRRCLAYLTIEHPGPIPEEFRPLLGDHLFGCDECLDVCPWNRHAQQSRELRLTPIPRADLSEMLGWDEIRFRREFRGTPIFRLKRARWLRNICTVLGNIGTQDDLPSLEKASQDQDPLVQEHARWGKNRIIQRLGSEIN